MTVTPRRIQRRRTAGWRAPVGAVYVGRPTLYGNPFQVARIGKVWVVFVDAAPGVTGRTIATVFSEREARQTAVDNFRAMLCTPGGAEQAEFFAQKLRGRDLMCWCPEQLPCHADVLLELLSSNATPTP
ncbi:DUF4326 domain-containing protein [Streptomyces sp. NPDC087850]|uniref:DUF4326 domain-containing protein n=1 Tax=Streptomyces sp. NPDC087850 TaxID=3365809 RepID=UPI003817E9B6